MIRSRAAVLDELAERTRIAGQTSDDEISRLVKELRRARQRLANLVVRGPIAEPEQYRTRLDEARVWKDAAEQKLATASLAFRGKLLVRGATWRGVQAALPPETALVAYVRYNHYEMEAKRSALTASAAAGGDSAVLSRVPRYAAFVLRAAADKPRLLSLGDAADIERQITRWGQEAAHGLRAPGWTAKQAEDACRAAGQALRELIWDPIEPYLEGASTVLVVPDAALHSVNLVALPAGEAEYLLEHGPTIHYLSTERDVVAFRESRSEGSGMLAVGAPDFDTPTLFAALATGHVPQRAAASTDDGAVAYRGERSSCGDFASLDFAELPASVREVKEVVQLWKRGSQDSAGVVQLIGIDATEQAFKAAAPGKRVLHIATHGFFLNGRCPSSVEVKTEARTIENSPPPTDAENPLLLSGLALAGANRRSSAGPEEEDGILTAEEVAALDLSGTDWAVLSACDTGVGDIKTGEGVFGLQRAFRIAGVRTLIVSLWAEEDEAVRHWMAELYRNHYLEGQTTAEAVRAASLEVLQQRRKRKQTTHPFYWAGFVATGDWD